MHRALLNNTMNLRAVMTALKERGAKGVMLTGSVFENDEGLGTQPLRAFSPYGLSKGLTWQVFRYYCGDVGLPLGKFVIPNPFGPLEETRFTAYLMKAWKEGKPASVKTPDYVRDNIHADLLAAVSCQFAERVAAGAEPECKLNPSGYSESQGAFALRLAREAKSRTPWTCEVQLAAQTEFTEPLNRTNQQPASPLVPGWSETAAWDQFVSFYLLPAKTYPHLRRRRDLWMLRSLRPIFALRAFEELASHPAEIHARPSLAGLAGYSSKLKAAFRSCRVAGCAVKVSGPWPHLQFVIYLGELSQNLAHGDATEHTHRPALKHCSNPSARISLPPTNRNEFCAARRISTSPSKVPLGHVETKDVGEKLDEMERGKAPTANSSNATLTLPNWILTDYLEFRWFVNGEKRLTARIAEIDARASLKPSPAARKKLHSSSMPSSSKRR